MSKMPRAVFRRLFKAARKELGVNAVSLSILLGRRPDYIENSVEGAGLTPAHPLFFPLCTLMGIEPEDCGFDGENAMIIRKWRDSLMHKTNKRGDRR